MCLWGCVRLFSCCRFLRSTRSWSDVPPSAKSFSQRERPYWPDYWTTTKVHSSATKHLCLSLLQTLKQRGSFLKLLVHVSLRVDCSWLRYRSHGQGRWVLILFQLRLYSKTGRRLDSGFCSYRKKPANNNAVLYSITTMNLHTKALTQRLINLRCLCHDASLDPWKKRGSTGWRNHNAENTTTTTK